MQNSQLVGRTAADFPLPFTLPPVETRMILVIGANLQLMEWAALSLYRAGHIPVLGQWFWPLVTTGAPADGEINESLDAVAGRLLGRCDALLQVDGPGSGSDALAAVARARGLRVFGTLEEAIAG